MTKKVGVYPGTFDPVHNGHVAFAQAAIDRLSLDGVYILPERNPRKTRVTSYAHRLSLLELALEPHGDIRVLELPSERFTIESTLPEIQALLPDAELVFLIGSDIVPRLAEWPDIDRLLDLCELVVGLRSNDNQETITAQLTRLGRHARFVLVDSPKSDHASSEVRSIGKHDTLDPSVASYIKENNLYN